MIHYYSSIFDHNPQFDPVQPSRQTVSFMGIPDNPTYDEYLHGQYSEIMAQYRPDGMWIGWYWPDQCTHTTIDFFRTNYRCRCAEGDTQASVSTAIADKLSGCGLNKWRYHLNEARQPL